MSNTFTTTTYNYMCLAFTSKKQVSKGLLTGDQKWTFFAFKAWALFTWKCTSLTQCMGRYTFKECTFTTSSQLKIWNLILNPGSLRLKTRSSRLETRSWKVSRIENRVSSLKDQDMSDCQLTFERYCNSIKFFGSQSFPKMCNFWHRKQA